MSDRAAEMGHEGATVCPFVAFQDDRERRATDPDHRHRCYAEPLPAPRAIAHQRRYCLSPEFPSCPIFQDWAIRAAATGVSMPSARRVTGPPAPIAPVSSGSNGSTKRTPDWAAPPPWVAAAGEAGDAAGGSERGQLTAFDDEGVDEEVDDDAPAAAAMAAADQTGTARPIRSTPVAESPRAPQPAARRPAAADADRPRTGRGFAYDLIAGDAAFAETADSNDPERPDAGDEEADDFEDDAEDGQPAWAALPPADAPRSVPSPYARGGPTPSTGTESMTPPTRPEAYVPPVDPYDGYPGAAGPDQDPSDGYDHAAVPPPVAPQPPPAPPGRPAARTPAGLPAPDYLPPAKQMATPSGRGRQGPFEGERDWERPKRFEAYPTLRTRVGGIGMPGRPRFGRLPPVAIGALALVLAAGILFALPGLFAGGLGGGGTTPGPSTSVRPSVSVAPTPTPVPTPEVYIVKRGDTFSGIATKHGLTIQELKDANPQIKDISKLQIGDRINIPDPFASPSLDAGEGEPTASPTE